jgi:hypothetical protein
MKKAVPFFLSYAHDDQAEVECLLKFLAPLLRSSAIYEFEGWSDRRILPGERWKAEIDQALASSCFGILLVSPAFLISEFIAKYELEPLLTKHMVVPVALQAITFDASMDLKGLNQHQVFHFQKRHSFDSCRSSVDRRRFTMELFNQIVKLLEKYPC